MTETDQQHAEDGPRLKHFRQAIQKMLQASIKQCTMGEKIDQTFKFNLAPAQLARLEAILSAEFSQTADLIKGNFEKALEGHELPAKLNQVDAVIRALPPRYQSPPLGDNSPTGLVQAALHPSKREVLGKLRTALDTIKRENELLTADVGQRQTVVEYRVGNIKAVRNSYVEAFSQSTDIGVGELEVMMDRMAHQQTVPIKPTNNY